MIFFKSTNSLKLNSYNIDSWTVNSWKDKKLNQIPEYNDKKKLDNVTNKLKNYSPLVFAGECDNLQTSIAKTAFGQNFLLMGGDCAEIFNEFSIDKVRDTYRIILQMGMILTYGSGLPTTKIGRIAGQFAKPRSESYEKINEKDVLTYRGDIINGYSEFDREPDPERMLSAYQQSVQTLNMLRGFSTGGYADINRLHAWNLDFVEKSKEGSKYRELSNKITKSLRFLKGLGMNTNSDLITKTNIYTGHECLLLPYEESLTRKDSITGKYYDCSSHFLWIGERTRQLDGAHLEFLRGVSNPIGIKLSDKINIDEITSLIKIINPDNIPGRITLITRMGHDKIKTVLPKLIRIIQNESLCVTWCCDPMHANTFKTKNGIKTRDFNLIKLEIIEYFNVHSKMGTFPGGLHLELTGQNVTECIGGEVDKITVEDLNLKYLSQCDPRLNADQSLEIAFIVSDLLQRFDL